MLFLATFFKWWMLGALVLGLIVGWLTFIPRPKAWIDRAVSAAIIIFAVGVIVALLRLLPGRAGYLLQLALLLFVAYVIGCFLGWLLEYLRKGQGALVPSTAGAAAGTGGTVAGGNLARGTVAGGALTGGKVAGGTAVGGTSTGGTVTGGSVGAPAPRPAAAATSAPPIPVAAASATPSGNKPAAIAAPPAGARDDLKLIAGIGPKNEAALHALGQYRFSQIGGWTPAEIAWLSQHLSLSRRIAREHWPEQAQLLAAGIETPHAHDVKAGRVAPNDAELTPDEAAKLTAALPQAAAALPDEGAHEGQRPLGLAAARNGQPDDLKRIKGIGQQNEGRLHGLGIWHFEQIAAWTAENVKWVGSYLAFPGRIDREQWVSQARVLTAGGDTDFSKRVDQGHVASSKDDGALGQNNVQSAKPRDPS